MEFILQPQSLSFEIKESRCPGIILFNFILPSKAPAIKKVPASILSGITSILAGCNEETPSIIIFVVPSTTQIRDFLFGSNWIDNINENTILIDLTTSNPDATKKLSNELSVRKINYIDCGMTGGAQGAENATLTFMMGGD